MPRCGRTGSRLPRNAKVPRMIRRPRPKRSGRSWRRSPSRPRSLLGSSAPIDRLSSSPMAPSSNRRRTGPGGARRFGRPGTNALDPGRQPLTLLAYVAANCLTALAQMPQVAPQRIGIIGLSYGGKWSMFASCLDERFACAVWSDPGIVFNEKDSNVNYWEPWYIGFDPKVQRREGVPSPANPRTGLYKEMIDAGEDLVDLHALMAPRPVL